MGGRGAPGRDGLGAPAQRRRDSAPGVADAGVATSGRQRPNLVGRGPATTRAEAGGRAGASRRTSRRPSGRPARAQAGVVRAPARSLAPGRHLRPALRRVRKRGGGGAGPGLRSGRARGRCRERSRGDPCPGAARRRQVDRPGRRDRSCRREIRRAARTRPRCSPARGDPSRGDGDDHVHVRDQRQAEGLHDPPLRLGHAVAVRRARPRSGVGGHAVFDGRCGLVVRPLHHGILADVMRGHPRSVRGRLRRCALVDRPRRNRRSQLRERSDRLSPDGRRGPLRDAPRPP